MAIDTSKDYRNQVMYSIFVRDFSDTGDFEGVRKDLDRIKDLGTDIIWLMPIQPNGEVEKKGSLGSPYAISDYRIVNPEYGTMEDFRRLADEIHAKGMKVIIDVVYNHTSPDSWLARNHPEWFHQDETGAPAPRVPDWSDVVDLDYSDPALWDYQIETLKQWASIVDGFRCDVAPIVPLDFWLRARAEVEKVRPGCFWLAETVEPEFIVSTRGEGIPMLSDSECYQAFDVTYDYDIYNTFHDAVAGKIPLSRYAEAVNRQESTYPDNFVKLRYLENHDRLRAADIIKDQGALENWTAFQYFQKGMPLVYAGQETVNTHTPSLFEREPVDWQTGKDISPLLRRLYEIKKDPIFTDSVYEVRAEDDDILVAHHRSGDTQLVGVFSTTARAADVPAGAPDGEYANLVDGARIAVKDGKVHTDGKPIIFKAPAMA